MSDGKVFEWMERMMRSGRPSTGTALQVKKHIHQRIGNNRIINTGEAACEMSISSSENSSPFIETERLLPCTQEPATCSCYEPHESTPQPHSLFL